MWLPRGRADRGGIEWEAGISRCKLLYIEWINNKVLLYSTGNFIQYPVINRDGKEYKKRMCVCVYIYINIYIYIYKIESLCCKEEINTL